MGVVASKVCAYKYQVLYYYICLLLVLIWQLNINITLYNVVHIINLTFGQEYELNKPEWNIWNYYAVDHLTRAFELDSLENSHPIEVKVGNPDEINQIFDSISYCKGSSIIRMLNDFIGN